ncbi:MAG: matrixin family metalloprotease [Candidatus Aenigmatarchaeota archaeon]
MKELLSIFAISVLFLAVAASAAIVIPLADKAKESAGVAVDKSPTINNDWVLNPHGLEKIEFIHYKKGYGKPEAAKAPKAPSCYKFLTGKVKWKTLPVNYVINPTNPQSLSESFVCSAVITSAETWDANTSKELFQNYDICPINYEATYGVRDYQNAITFGDYPTEGVIAVTTVWYNPATKAIVEFDMMFDTDWRWGDADTTPTTDPEDPTAVMDLQNIATHELGHGIGLADVYDSACSAITMYGYSDYEETQKRTLEQPDVTGLQTLYGA